MRGPFNSQKLVFIRADNISKVTWYFNFEMISILQIYNLYFMIHGVVIWDSLGHFEKTKDGENWKNYTKNLKFI